MAASDPVPSSVHPEGNEDGVAPEGVAFKFNLAHQEMARVMTELETIYSAQPCEWLPVEALGNMLSQELGYEDVAEFEDALQGEFCDFVDCLPHTEISYNERGTKVLRIRPHPADMPPRRMRLRITERRQLWHVFLQAPDARVILPEIEEFEFQPMGQRRIDSVYNHIASAIYNLGKHVQDSLRVPGSMTPEVEGRFLDTIHLLNKALDVEHPFTWLVEDPTSASLWQPLDDVEIEVDGRWVPAKEVPSVQGVSAVKVKKVAAGPAPGVDVARGVLQQITAPGVVLDHEKTAAMAQRITEERYKHYSKTGMIHPAVYPPPAAGDGSDVFKAADEGGEGLCTRKEIAKYLMRNQSLRHRLREGWAKFNLNFGTEDTPENHEELTKDQFCALWAEAAALRSDA
eukprot:TRINITY_DN2926_c0_g1_i1.p1 TRINITY_DN2926_c0_g1~~TRINITY_DN2926_c0_g1_i1.p1  ORF type:complete len:424 (+),score=178.33 TRINITY_DN2926_c0_g1_i1:72-1274(+)